MGGFLLSVEKILVKCELSFGAPHMAARTLPALVSALLNAAFKGKEDRRRMAAVQRLMWAE